MKRILPFFNAFTFGALLLSCVIFTNIYTTAHADESTFPNPEVTMEDQATKWLFYRGIWSCMTTESYVKDGDGDRMKAEDLNSGAWFNGNKKGFGYLGPGLDGADGNDGTVSCSNKSYMIEGANTFGFASGVEFWCALNKYDPGTYMTPNGGDDNCTNSTLFQMSLSGSSLASALTKLVHSLPGNIRYDRGNNPNAGALFYWIQRKSLEIFCGGGQSMADAGQTNTTLDDKKTVSVRYIDPLTGGGAGDVVHYDLDGREEGDTVNDAYYYADDEDNASDVKCSKMSENTRDYATSYARYVISAQFNDIYAQIKDGLATEEVIKAECGTEPVVHSPSDGWNACINNLKSNIELSLGECVEKDGVMTKPMTYGDRFDLMLKNCSVHLAEDTRFKPATRDALVAAFTNFTKKEVQDAQLDTVPGGGTSCAVDGIGWIVCPVMTFLGTMTDIAFNFLSTTFLETKASYFNISGSNNSAYQAWSYMRNLANVAFVIAFLFIIYSQITGLGASNYGIKKLLPKIIVAAILVNISFFICQIAIDISNILGYSLKSLFDTIGTNFKSPDAVTEDASGNGFGIAAIIVGLLAAGIGLALALSIPVILAALLALTIIVFILLARTALIILLVVVAPLAFVAYLLPNTEDWYKKWQKMFTGLLLVFPIIAVVFGAAGLAAKIVNDAAGGDKMLQVMAIGIATVPLFAVPGLLKGAMSAAGAIGSKLSAASNKANSRATGSANKKMGERYQGSAFARGQALRKQGKEEFRNRRFTKAVAGEDTGLVGRMRRRASRGLTGRTFTGAGEFAQDSAEKAAKGASARAEAKEYGEAVEAATAAQRTMTVDDVAKIASTGTHNGQKVTEHERAAAIDRTMSSGGFSQRKEVLEGLATDKAGTSRELRNRAVSAAYSKGDQNIYGAGFGDQILDEGGSINSAADLASAAVTNAEEGHVAAEHLVQNGSATKYLVGATLASGNTVARGKLATARDAARSTGSTQAKIDPTIEGEFARL